MSILANQKAGTKSFELESILSSCAVTPFLNSVKIVNSPRNMVHLSLNKLHISLHLPKYIGHNV